MPLPLFTDMDMSNVQFSALYTVQSKSGQPMQKVDVSFKAPESRDRFEFNLCPQYRTAMFPVKFDLDTQGDGGGVRRGLAISLNDDDVARKMEEFDELVVRTAVEQWKTWFPKGAKLSELEVRARYKPLAARRGDDPFPTFKFKVKCPGSEVPTKMHLLEGDNAPVENAATIDHLVRQAQVAPILSIFGLWFMSGGSTFGVSVQAEQLIVRPTTLTSSPLDQFTAGPSPAVHLRDDPEEAPAAKRACGSYEPYGEDALAY